MLPAVDDQNVAMGITTRATSPNCQLPEQTETFTPGMEYIYI